MTQSFREHYLACSGHTEQALCIPSAGKGELPVLNIRVAAQGPRDLP